MAANLQALFQRSFDCQIDTFLPVAGLLRITLINTG